MPSKDTRNDESFSVILVGSYVQDHVWLTDQFPRPGETRRALGFSTGPGGKGFNQAIACVRQGGRALFIGALGNDALGAGARECAEHENLACEWLVLDDVPTAAACIVVAESGANQIMVNLAANEKLLPGFVLAQSARFARARVLLVQLENNLDAIRLSLELGRRHGLLCVLNPAPMHAEVDAAFLSACDLITPNETEFAQLLERIGGESLSADSIASSPEAALHAHCRKLGVATVVITLGSAGCFVSHASHQRRGDSEDHYRIAAEKVSAIDTTAAGDAFNGALVAALAGSIDAPFRDAVRHANRVAALSTEKRGAALSIPTAAEVSARFVEG